MTLLVFELSNFCHKWIKNNIQQSEYLMKT